MRLRWRLLITAGALTYPFYLVHQSIGIPLAKGLVRALTGLGPLPSMAVAILAMLGLSLLIHRLVERRLGGLLKHRLTLDMRPRDLVAERPFTPPLNAPIGPATGPAPAGPRLRSSCRNEAGSPPPGRRYRTRRFR